jgi:hypothetical protein
VGDPEYTLQKLGLLEQTPDVRAMVQHMATEAYFRSMEVRLMPAGKEAAQALKYYAEVVIRASDQIRGHSELAKLLEQLRSVGMKLKKPIAHLQSPVEEGQILDNTALAELTPGEGGLR